MAWQKIALTNSQVAQGHLEHILKQCLPIMVKSGKTKLESPLMGNPDKDKITNVYFPPEIVPFWSEILSEYGAVSCEAPTESTTPMVRLNQSAK